MQKSEHTWNENAYQYGLFYNFAFNLISFYVCPRKYLCKLTHKHSSTSSIQNGHFPHSYNFATADGQCVLTFQPAAVYK